MIKLEIKGIGPTPSFKNGKQISINRKTGQRFLRTATPKKQWMDLATDQLESQLRGLFPINAGETLGEWEKRLQTVWWQLLDDSLMHQLPGNQNVRFVSKGNEGAEITIGKL